MTLHSTPLLIVIFVITITLLTNVTNDYDLNLTDAVILLNIKTTTNWQYGVKSAPNRSIITYRRKTSNLKICLEN